ncbi:amidohydrolase family protein, partial [Candidatus Bathyarchaeota archaeon]|nr:amidohydrolase family protein [Candidatus Bathyarchaeota archaeon]
MSANPCEADLVLLKGKILTVDDEFTVAEAVAVKDGRVMAVGSSTEIEKLKGRSTEVIDLEGKTVMPGLYDSHIHVVGTGTALQMINCRTPPMMSIEDMKKAVAEKTEDSKPGEWILGRGWDQAKLAEHRNPSRWDLDEASPDNPVVLTRTCGHLLVANSAALEIGGITKDTPDPLGGKIVRNLEGEPTGMLEEGPAMNLVRRHIPETGIPETMDAI